MCQRLERASLKKKDLKTVERMERDFGVEVLEARQTSRGIVPTLINGIPVHRRDWPEVVWINRSCTATLVGPNCALTAAHCGNNGERGSLELFDGTEIDFTMHHMPQWQDASDWDLAVLALDERVDVPFATVGLDHVFRVGQTVLLAGFGCTNPNGTGGNDGILRKGPSKIVNASGRTDIYSQWPEGNGGALCYGDSGGPMFASEERAGERTIIAINSKGNIRDTNYNMRLDLPEVKTFLEEAADDHGLQIKGLNMAGGGGGGGGAGELIADVKLELRELAEAIQRLDRRLGGQ